LGYAVGALKDRGFALYAGAHANKAATVNVSKKLNKIAFFIRFPP